MNSMQVLKTKKRVSFSEQDDIHQIEVFENQADRWFTAFDYRNFRERDFQMGEQLKCMNPTFVELKFGDSARGLEFTQDDFGKAMRLRRTGSLAAVVWSQKPLQQQRRINAQDAIAQTYGHVSEGAVRHAIERAGDDERFVNNHVRASKLPQTTTSSTSRNFQRRFAKPPSLLGRQVDNSQSFAMAC
jgi:hypothetical protein